MIDHIDDNSYITEIMYEIERIRDGSIDYMDAIITYCEINDIEIDSIAKYIKNNLVLKSKLQEEAEELNYLQKTVRLPV